MEKAGKGTVCFFSFAELNTELQLLHPLWEEEEEGATENNTAQRKKTNTKLGAAQRGLFDKHQHVQFSTW